MDNHQCPGRFVTSKRASLCFPPFQMTRKLAEHAPINGRKAFLLKSQLALLNGRASMKVFHGRTRVRSLRPCSPDCETDGRQPYSSDFGRDAGFDAEAAKDAANEAGGEEEELVSQIGGCQRDDFLISPENR